MRESITGIRTIAARYDGAKMEISPCPVCGGEMSVRLGGDVITRERFVYCNSCPLVGPRSTNAFMAISFWNEGEFIGDMLKRIARKLRRTGDLPKKGK